MIENVKTIVPATFPELAALSDLRRYHSAMLQRQENRDAAIRPTPEEIAGFLIAIRELGRRVSDLTQRETAQGMMDYWTGKLLSQVPQAIGAVKSFYLTNFDPASAGQDTSMMESEQQLLSIAEKGEQLFATTAKGERDCLVRLLLRLFRLKENSLEVYPVPLAHTDDKATIGPRQSLIEAGILRQREPGNVAQSYELTQLRLLSVWKTLNTLVKERRGFRELARGWDKAGRCDAALLNGGLALRRAEVFSDLDDLETEFLRASRKNTETRWKVGFTTIILLVAVFGSLETYNNWKLKSERARLKASNQQLQDALDAAQLALKSAENFKSLHSSKNTFDHTSPDWQAYKKEDDNLTGIKERINAQVSRNQQGK